MLNSGVRIPLTDGCTLLQ